MNMAGKVVLVTGAGSGIGRAVALGFLGRGDTVVLAGRRRDALEETRTLAGAGATALALPTDVADPGSVAQLFATAADAYGRLVRFFNNRRARRRWFRSRT